MDDKERRLKSADIFTDIIALGSPSGKMSKRSLRVAQKRLHERMIEAGYFQPAPEPKTDRALVLERNIRNIEELLERGMKPKGYKKALAEWRAELDAIRANSDT